MSRRAAHTLLSLTFIPFLLADGPRVAARPAERAALVTVIADAGTPIRDLTARDFVVKEDGRKAEVVDAKLTKDPLSVALLIDISQPPRGAARPVQDLRNAAAAFVKTIHAVSPDAQIALVMFAGAAVTAVDFTNKSDELEAAISKIFPNQQTVAVLLEAMLDSAKKLEARPAPRRAMVSIDFSSSEGSPERMVQQAADAVTNSGATFWAVSVRGTASASATREEVLNKMTKASGGKRFSTVESSGLEGMLKTVAASLTSQYLVTFISSRDGAAKSTTFEVADGRKVLLTPFMR
jgi:VWFA-related protein